MADEDVEVVEQVADEEVTEGRHITLEFTDAVNSGDKVG